MDRRLVIALVAFVLSPAALAVAGLYAAAAPPSPATADASQQVLAAAAIHPLVRAGMSGDFADRRLADAGALKVLSATKPPDWRRLRTHGAAVGQCVFGGLRPS